jgi:hypothetical protein
MKTTLLLSVLVFAGCVESIPEPTCSPRITEPWGVARAGYDGATCGEPWPGFDQIVALCCDGGEFFLPLCTTRGPDGAPYPFMAECHGPDAEPFCNGSEVGIPAADGIAPICRDVCPGVLSQDICP